MNVTGITNYVNVAGVETALVIIKPILKPSFKRRVCRKAGGDWFFLKDGKLCPKRVAELARIESVK